MQPLAADPPPDDLAALWERWRSLEQAHTQVRTEADLVRAQLTAAEHELQKCLELRASTLEHAAQHDAAGKALPACQEHLYHMEEKEQHSLACARLLGMMERVQREQAAHRIAYEQARAASARAAALYLEQIRYELSTQLTPGTPCPVCGSLTHPSPAAPPAEFVSRQTVDQCSAQAAAAGRVLAACDARYHALNEQFSALHAALQADGGYEHAQLIAAQKAAAEARAHQDYAVKLTQKADRLAHDIERHEDTIRMLQEQMHTLTRTADHTAAGLRLLEAQLHAADPDGMMRVQLNTNGHTDT